jgi:3D (Asp-Asp-Asp) domain-containing protein
MSNGITKTYNYSGVGNMQTDCTPYFRGQHRATGRVKFSEVKSAWGLGVRNYSLIPYRTVAVDPNVIPYGSVVHIPDAVGKEVTLADGTSFIHDGYFFAGDTGGAIQNNHIDVFTGNNSHSDLSFIRSTSSATFNAEIVHDPELQANLERLHRHDY